MTLVVPVVVVRHLHIITIMVVLINVVVVMDNGHGLCRGQVDDILKVKPGQREAISAESGQC